MTWCYKINVNKQMDGYTFSITPTVNDVPNETRGLFTEKNDM